jgi:hypothetical protein
MIFQFFASSHLCAFASDLFQGASCPNK